MSIVYHIFKSIDSTNQFLKTLPNDTQTHVCRSDMQTEGRGRLQRPWYSPESNNIYLSVRYPYSSKLKHLNGLSLVVSLSLLKTLQQYGIHAPILIKWPNDLLWQDKKLAGILIEIIPEAIIIGIGLNVTASPSIGCSLKDITALPLNREIIVSTLLQQLEQDFILFKQHGFAVFRSHWLRHNAHRNKVITITLPTGQLQGTVHDIDEQGCLILMDCSGRQHIIAAGEATFKNENSEH